MMGCVLRLFQFHHVDLNSEFLSINNALHAGDGLEGFAGAWARQAADHGLCKQSCTSRDSVREAEGQGGEILTVGNML